MSLDVGIVSSSPSRRSFATPSDTADGEARTSRAFDWSTVRLGIMVAGNLIGLAMLRSAVRSRRKKPERLWIAAGMVVGVTALDVLGAVQARRRSGGATGRTTSDQPIAVIETISVNRPIAEVFAFWRNFENLPQFMANLESVKVTGERQSHWRAKGPAGTSVEWDADIVDEQTDRLISWQSRSGADVANSGAVRFSVAPGNRGTEIRVELRYRPPAGRLGAAVARLMGKEPGQEVKADLRRLKQVLEVGEVVKSDASIHSGPHPARPARNTQQKGVHNG